jgi:hypothetical protein
MLRRVLVTVVGFSFLLVAQVLALNRELISQLVPVPPYLTNRTTWDCNMWLTLTNYGIIGTSMEGFPDPETGLIAPSCEFPAGRSLEYMSVGAVWAGAIVNGDTLVSTATDGWWDTRELYPEPYPEGDMVVSHYYADREIVAVYYDTCTGGFVEIDPIDNRPHIPLGLKIAQTAYCWASPGFDDFVILEFQFENIGGNFLEDAYLGIFCDGDVHHKSSWTGGAHDDITGFTLLDGHPVAWIGDNDGDPSEGQWDSMSVRPLVGITILDAPELAEGVSFNWWISNVNPDLDWGPQRADNYRYFHNGNLGTPTGDANRYFVMSNGDHDYDQAWCAIDHTAQGWLPPPSFGGGGLAKGLDARYLFSFGPFDLQPGDVKTVTLAVVGGENWHVNPHDAHEFLENPEDSNVVREFYNRLNFDDFLRSADVASQVYENGYRNVPPGPPRNFKVDSWNDQTVTLKWTERGLFNLQSYNVYRTTQSGSYQGPAITPSGFTDTTFVDTGVQEDVLYYYVITTSNTNGLEGGHSPEVFARVGWPEPPVGLSAENGNREVTLTWRDNPEGDLYGYIVHRSVAGGTFSVIDTVDLEPRYHQTNLQNAVLLDYYITAIDTLGHESYPSDTVRACPMAFDSGILLVDDTRDAGGFVPPPSAVNYLYFRALQQYLVGNWQYDERGAPLLSHLSPYSTVVWYNEAPTAVTLPFDTMADYLRAGGNLVLICWRGLNSWQSPFGEGDFAHDFLKLESVDYPAWVPGDWTEFGGAIAAREGYSDFRLNASRVDSLWPSLHGRLPWVGALQPDSSGEVLFRFNSDLPETSQYHNQPVGVGYFGEDYKAVVLNFPVYFVQEPASIELLDKIVEEMGESKKTEPEPEEPVPLPTEFALYQSYPNPFNYATVIAYDLCEECHVELTVYNILGQSVKVLVDEVQPRSRQLVPWDGTDDRGKAVASGIYFYRLKTTGFSEVKRMLLVK